MTMLTADKPMRLVQASRLWKTFRDGKAILRDITLSANAGEVLTIWGPNGSGKSTLLRILARIWNPDVRAETRLHYAPESRLGYVPQDVLKGLLPWYSASRNIAFYLDSNQGDDSVQTLLDDFGFDNSTALARPGRLSGGYQQRLALACAMARHCNVLLLDESFAGLDVRTMVWTIASIRKFALSCSAAVVAVTHDPEAALLLSDRVAILAPSAGSGSTVHGEITVILEERTIEALSTNDGHRLRERLYDTAYYHVR